MSESSYKQQKEAFVSNLSGGPVSEIAAVTAVAPVAILLWSALQARQSFFSPSSPLSYAVDFLLHVGAFLLATTLYASTPMLLLLLLLAPVAIVYVMPPRKVRSTLKKKKTAAPAASAPGAKPLNEMPIKPFLTWYRGAMMIMTCVSILAVDFRLFPRRFAKVETWGTSLMDIGVGSFVFTAGVVAARPVLKERASGHSIGLLRRLVSSARHSLPLLVLGVIRLLSVKGLDYAEHVSEYGVHWNFFFTLGLLPPFVAAFQAVLRYVPSYAALAVSLSAGYQVLLETTSLKAYVLTAPRQDLLSMNREGIFSFFGYLAIFLAGQDLGMFALPRSSSSSSTGNSTASRLERKALLRTMAVRAALWSTLYYLSTSYTLGLGLNVSRRMANLPYVLWVAAFNTIQILACCAIETFFFPGMYSYGQDAKTEREAIGTATSAVLGAYNRNGLAVFLVANLLTGLVNMTVRTLECRPVETMGILLGYMGAVTAVAVSLDYYDVSIKL